MARNLHPRLLCLVACSATVIGLSVGGDALAAPTMEGTKAPGTAKESPYASAKDETNQGESAEPGTPTEKLGGTKAAGSTKESPYASAKDEHSVVNEPTLGRLWGLLLPVGLAAGSYAYLRSRERGRLS